MIKKSHVERRLPHLTGLRLTKIALLTAAGATGAWFAFGLAMSGVTRGKAPEMALTYVPNEGRALATKAERIFFESPTKPKQEAQFLARKALENQILNPSALRTLGYYADATGKAASAEAYMMAAQRLSRRDAGAQLWLLDRSARTGDAKGTLGHYDILLNTQPSSRDVLFPRLVVALAHARIRSALSPYLMKKAGWSEAFLAYAISNTKDLHPLVQLVVESDEKSDSENIHALKIDLLKRLVDQASYADAKTVFFTMNGARKESIANPAFSLSDVRQQYGAMGWQRIEVADAGVDFDQENGKVVLKAYANPNTTRVVTQKLLYLTPGAYRLTTTSSSENSGDASAGLRWTTSCSSASAQAGSPTVIRAPKSSSTFTVPSGCPAVMLNLVISGGPGREGIEAIITDVQLQSVGN